MELLGDPEYFDCERTHCKLRVAICVGRQKANEQREPFNSMAFPICEKCKQGEKNRASFKPLKKDQKPRRGEGERDTECDFYRKCLNRAASREWRTFNCESCLQEGEMEEKPAEEKNERICVECKLKPTIHPNSPLCASCMALKAKAKREARRAAEAAETVKGKTTAAAEKSTLGQMAKPDQADDQPESAQMITINFGKHMQVLDQIRALADNELRPLDLQVIYILKIYLTSQGGQPVEG